jgi:hypothetical protein
MKSQCEPIYEVHVFKQGHRTAVMMKPLNDGDLMTPGPTIFKGQSHMVMKQDRDARGNIIRQEPATFPIEATDPLEALHKWDAAHEAMIREATKPQITDAKGITLPPIGA